MSMLANRDEILNAALQLSESDRLLIVTCLLDTLPAESPSDPQDELEFLAEMERRANDNTPTIPLSDLWKRD